MCMTDKAYYFLGFRTVYKTKKLCLLLSGIDQPIEIMLECTETDLTLTKM